MAVRNDAINSRAGSQKYEDEADGDDDDGGDGGDDGDDGGGDDGGGDDDGGDKNPHGGLDSQIVAKAVGAEVDSSLKH